MPDNTYSPIKDRGLQPFIAFDRRTGLHSIVWLVRNNALSAWYGDIDPLEMNALLKANNVRSLLNALEDYLMPLVKDDSIGGQSGRRWYSSLEFRELYRAYIGRPDPAVLSREAFFYPLAKEHDDICGEGEEEWVAPFSPATKQAAAKEASVRFDVAACYEFLCSHDASEYSVCIEPLQEWLFVRNALSLSASIYVLLTSGVNDSSACDDYGLLSKTPFKYIPYNSLVKGPCYVAPFLFNAFLGGGGPITIDSIVKTVTARRGDMNPLREFVTSLPRELAQNPLRLHVWQSLRGFDNVQIMTQVQADALRSRPARRRHGVVFAEYVVLPTIPGRPFRDVLADAFHAFHQAVFSGPNGLWEDGFDFGDEPLRKQVSEEAGDSLLVYKSLLPALWNAMIHHRGQRLIICEHCGNTVLASTRGGSSRYCSMACRTGAAKRRSANKAGEGA